MHIFRCKTDLEKWKINLKGDKLTYADRHTDGQTEGHCDSDMPNKLFCGRITKNEITLTIYESTQGIAILKKLLDSNESTALSWLQIQE